MTSRVRRLIRSSIIYYLDVRGLNSKSNRDLFAGMERNLKKYEHGYSDPDFEFNAAECERAARIVLYCYNWRSAWFARMLGAGERYKRIKKAYFAALDRREKAYKERGGKTIRAKV